MSQLERMAEAGMVETDVELGPLTTYKFGGPARWFVSAHDADTVGAIIEAARNDGAPYLILGRGSNLVVSDVGFNGLVLRLAGALATATIAAGGNVTAGGAMPLPKLARMCAKAGRGGLEFLVAVPGSVGGAVRMNAGCHGSETGEWLVSVDVYRPGRGRRSIDRSEIEMTYRHSSLPPGDVVLFAEFATIARSAAESDKLMREITQWRRENQPGGTFNAGSVFKNPQGTSAGRIIDSLGLKGFRMGGAMVSERHANFFEADTGASAQDVYDLVMSVRHRVAAATGIVLEPEIQFAGHFNESELNQLSPVATAQRETAETQDHVREEYTK